MLKNNFFTEDLGEIRKNVLREALPNVVFEGWSKKLLIETSLSLGLDETQLLSAFPKEEIDLALYFHSEGDKEMAYRIESINLSNMRYRDKIAMALKLRLAIASVNKEAVRRASSLFLLPINLSYGVASMWDTVDAVWSCLGDDSDDLNWYTKRMTLYLVYSSSLLFWLGDDSDNNIETSLFIDRRIDNVMSFQSNNSNLKRIFDVIAPIGKRIIGENMISKENSLNFPGNCSR